MRTQWVEHTDYPVGVVEVFDSGAYNATHQGSDIATCGHCERSWDDGHVSTWTPAPSGRCPFEYDHEYPEV
jgi:hypothetical protein